MNRIRFDINKGRALAGSILPALAFVILMTYLIFGELFFLRPFLLALSLLLFAAVVITIMGSVVLDDDGRRISIPGFSSIPYDRVKGIRILRRGKSIHVYVKAGMLYRTVVSGLDVSESGRLVAEFTARFPGMVAVSSSYSVFTLAVVLFSSVLVVISVYMGYMWEKVPHIFEPARVESIEPVKTLAEAHRFGGFIVFQPSFFLEAYEKKGEIIFLDTINTRKISVFENRKGKDFFHEFVLGVSGVNELFEKSVRSRIGAIPLALKASFLKMVDSPRFYSFKSGGLECFAVNGEKEGQGFAYAVFSDTGTRKQIEVYFQTHSRISEEEMRSFLGTVSVRTAI